MRLKTVIATILSTAMAVCILAAPSAELQTKAAVKGAGVYTNNQATGIPGVNIQTPQETVKLYARLSWALLEEGVGVRLNVTDSGCGPVAKRSLTSMAASLGASEVKTLDMDLEMYIGKGGWTEDIPETNGRIRVCIVLPEGSDLSKDYGVISIKKDGVMEVLGDLDLTPDTVTVDSDYFDTFMIVSAPAGTFYAYRVANPNALDKLETPVYVKKIGSTIKAESRSADVYSLGILTDVGAVRAAAGGKKVDYLELNKTIPGASAKNSLDNAIKQTKAENKTAPLPKKEEDDKKEDTQGYDYYEMELKTGAGERINSTNGKQRITMTVPYSFPAYADYAVAVLNMDGSVSILKDIDFNESTITVDTDQFRTYVFLWGRKGAFDGLQ